MPVSDRQFRDYFKKLSRKRGMPDFFDRFEQDSILSDGLRLHLDVIEIDKTRPTAVFMPGTNAYALLYGEFLTALADRGYNIVGFDPRGHGRSEGARGSYTLPELVGDMRSATEYARKRFGGPIVVAGSSQGGITAFYLCLGRTDRGGDMPQPCGPGRPVKRKADPFSSFSRTAA